MSNSIKSKQVNSSKYDKDIQRLRKILMSSHNTISIEEAIRQVEEKYLKSKS